MRDERPSGTPVGYRVLQIPCCATCEYYTELGDNTKEPVNHICEILGEFDDLPNATFIDPLGICDAFRMQKGGD